MHDTPLGAFRSTGLVLIALVVLVAASATPAAARANASARTTPNVRPPTVISACTMVIPVLHASIGVQMAHAPDFCELVSRALAGDVFRSSVIVTPGRLWHYADATLSCRLRYGHTSDRILIHNSVTACRWLTRAETAWHREPSR